MKTVSKRRFLKSIALFFAFNILLDVTFPSIAWALTDGPKQPEYSSFEPVATTNMVSDFTGAFAYNLPVVNVPGPNGSGYAMSLSYHSGSNSESESSWVGHGWSLNPGAINRNLQGIPDDYNGDGVTYFNKRKPHITTTFGPQVGAEAYSIDVNANFTYSYNNYRGFGTKLGLGLGIGYGVASLGYTVSGQEPGSFTAEANPGALLKVITAAVEKKIQKNNTKTDDSKTSEENEKVVKQNKKLVKLDKLLNSKVAKKLEGIKIGINSNSFNMTTALDHYSDACFSLNFTTTFGLDPTLLHIGVEFGYEGSLSFLQNQESFTESKSGLLYSSKNDYTVEKENPYNLRDRYLPIPHKAKDQFMITGEMMNGGFSLVEPNLGQAEIASQANSVSIFNGGMDNNVGFNTGVGANVGLGVSLSQVSSSDYSFPTSSSLSPYFRFNNDMGGEVVYSGSNVHSYTSGLTPPNIDLNAADYNLMNVHALSSRAGSAGFIGYTTKGDRANASIFSATKDMETLNHLTASVSPSRITDIYTVNDKGSKLIYGLPVFVSGETQASEDVLQKGYTQDGVADIFIKTDGSTETLLGFQNSSAYATSFLLTQINTADYIDRKLDGPSNDDFGGWTKFGYRDPAYVTGGDKNFRYRMPYVGLSYQQNSLTDKDDDLGSYQSGTKEMYYLKQVETKTHIAFFITNKTNFTYCGLTLQGSGVDRHDGVEAAKDEDARNGQTSSSDHQPKRPEYLEKIVVYSKKDLTGKPLSTVNFEYSYEISPGVLNHVCTDTDGKGKLTLKKVWFEYEGVIGAKIAPYEFTYAYKLPTAFNDADLKAKYTDVINHGSSFTADEQNPAYKTWAIDPWGNYRNDGTSKISKKENGVKQKFDSHLDPAAWQLKQIKLPTGGEILIQYEQHDYRYVQDQPALTMVPLSGSSSDIVYTIDDNCLQDLNVTGDVAATTVNKLAYVAQLNSYFAKEKIYFKFLYSVLDNKDEASIDVDDCSNEYIDGFASASAALSDGNISILLDDGSNSPKEVCQWYVKRMIAGKPIEGECDKKNIDLYFPENSVSNDVESAIRVGKSVFGAAAGLAADDLNAYKNAACPSMSITHSYLRVPVFKVKKGGGARVKRILMYDQGIEAASGTKDRDEVLYGTEYIYQGEDGLSSGVATNEPTGMHEENALVRSIVQRNDPTWRQKMMSGVDRECFEGPLGEQLLPSASIGYSRIITQNIHSGKSNTGYKIAEYATCKDFPFKAKNSSVRSPEPDKYNIPAIIVSVDVDRRAAAQSYEFLINDMHGKLKSIKMYKGSYDFSTHQDDRYTFAEVHDYYGLEDKVNVMDRSGAITPDYIGKEETITFESRHAQDEYMGMSTQFDASVGYEPPVEIIPQFSGMGYIGYSFKEFRSAVFNKTISITAIEKSVTTTSDGITHVQEFKVFNKYTGEPVIIDTYDGYDGLSDLQQAPGTYNGRIRSHKIPAHYAFEGMGQKVQNEQLTFSSKTFSFSSNKLTVGTDVQYFVEGDLLALTAGSTRDLYYVDSKSGSDLTLVRLLRAGKSVYTGTLSDGPVDVKIINSGYTNQLDDEAATVITYGNGDIIQPTPPTVLYSEVYDGTAKSLKSVAHTLSSSATLYSNNWVSSVVRGGEADDDYSLGMKGKWRMKSQAVFNTSITDAFVGTDRVYNASGTYTMDPYLFTSANTNDKWIVSSLVNTYSSDGNMLEDQNALGTKSSADFSHQHSVPSYIAKNAPYGSCTFQSYEDNTTATSLDKAHTGKRSLKVLPTISAITDTTLLLDAPTKQKDVLVRFWLNAANAVMDDVNKSVRVNVTDVGNTVTITPKLTKIAQVGEWTLYEGVVRGLSNLTPTSFQVTTSNIGTTPIYIDDFRVQPSGAEMMCYAYDGDNLRLIATFDDQHFSLLYQYNGEGKLVRKIVETERGVKTISETQYNVPKQAR